MSFGVSFLIKVSLSAENAFVVAETQKRGQPGPFSLVHHVKKRLLLLLERVATHAASSH